MAVNWKKFCCCSAEAPQQQQQQQQQQLQPSATTPLLCRSRTTEFQNADHEETAAEASTTLKSNSYDSTNNKLLADLQQIQDQQLQLKPKM